MLKQLTITLDTSDPLQAQLLVEYLAAQDRARFGRCCLLLGYLAATRQTADTESRADSAADPARAEVDSSTRTESRDGRRKQDDRAAETETDFAPDPDRPPRAPAGHIGAGLLGLK